MEKNSSSEPQLFHCPTCGAALPVPDAVSVRCEYCGSNVLVPPEYRTGKRHAAAPAMVIQLPEVSEAELASSRRNASKIVMVIIAVIVLVTIGGFALAAAGIFTTAKIVDKSLNSITTQVAVSLPLNTATQVPTTPTATPLPPISVDLKFGGEGTGAGQFDDPRYIALDVDNNIFIADYSDGRIQKFDPGGKFLQQINIEPDRNQNTIIRDMVTDYGVGLYVVRGGDILVYDSKDGKLVRTIPGKFPELSFDKLAIDAANNLYGVSEGAGFFDLIKMDSQGKQIWKKSNFLDGVVKKGNSAYVSRITVDGLGNIFILNESAAEVYKFDTQGNFLDRFGSKGRGLQQFNSPDAMALDGSGRLFVVDSGNWYTLKAFDSGGSFLGGLAWPDEITFPRDIIFDLQGHLYTVSNTAQVARMSLDPAWYNN